MGRFFDKNPQMELLLLGLLDYVIPQRSMFMELLPKRNPQYGKIMRLSTWRFRGLSSRGIRLELVFEVLEGDLGV